MGMTRYKALFTLLLMFLVACAPATQSQPETATAVPPTALATLPTHTAVPSTTAPMPEPATAVPTEPASPSSQPPTPGPQLPTPGPQIVAGRTAEGAFFYGNPDAAVTMIDYSDFL
ncbi:MAG: hypothetical protein IPM39_18900 [Chloroflexi bacterium]|nr:hypothetical protein [Chloroflexota bacterium]